MSKKYSEPSLIDKILKDAEVELDEQLIQTQKAKYIQKLKELKTAQVLCRNINRELGYIKQEIADELGIS